MLVVLLLVPRHAGGAGGEGSAGSDGGGGGGCDGMLQHLIGQVVEYAGNDHHSSHLHLAEATGQEYSRGNMTLTKLSNLRVLKVAIFFLYNLQWLPSVNRKALSSTICFAELVV